MLQKLLKPLWIILFSLIIVFCGSCSGTEDTPSFDCTKSDLVLSTSDFTNPTSCTLSDGSITVLATGGNEPYKYAINDGAFGNVATFGNLGAGDYTVRVKDKNGCGAFVEVSLVLPGDDPLFAETILTHDTECFTNNGSIEVTASGGESPYLYKLNSGAYGDATVFGNLAPGNYSISVKDALNCIFVKSVTVVKGDSETSLEDDIIPIINAKCAVPQCHNGSQSPDLSSPTGVRNNATAIKRETQNGNMPKEGSITSEQKALIACWVDEGAKNN